MAKGVREFLRILALKEEAGEERLGQALELALRHHCLAADAVRHLLHQLEAPSEVVYVNQKEVIHNNGPYGLADVYKSIWAVPSAGCAVSYLCTGLEESVTINDMPLDPPCEAGKTVIVANADVLDVHFQIDDLAVSVDYWQQERWDFHIDPCDGQLSAEEPTECTVLFIKTLEHKLPHVIDPDGATAGKMRKKRD
jgi:hypothetical protein